MLLRAHRGNAAFLRVSVAIPEAPMLRALNTPRSLVSLPISSGKALGDKSVPDFGRALFFVTIYVQEALSKEDCLQHLEVSGADGNRAPQR